MSLSAIILAAGKATRMKSERVKVLHEICGRPMLSYVLDACRSAGVQRMYVVIGYDRDRVMATYESANDITWVVQDQQKGTGHAAACAKEKLLASEGTGDDDHVYVLAGDGPLIRKETLQAMADKHRAAKAAVTLATAILPDPTGYGRILRDAEGKLQGIVEQKDATPEQRKIQEVNPTYWMFRTRDMFESLERVTPSPASGEYYITDTLHILRNMGRVLEGVPSVPPEDVLSINTRKELANVNRVMQQRLQKFHMENGVTLVSPENTWIEFGAGIGQDAVLEPFTCIGSGAYIAPGMHVKAGTVIPPGTRVE